MLFSFGTFCIIYCTLEDKLVVSSIALAKQIPFTLMKRDHSFVRNSSRPRCFYFFIFISTTVTLKML